MVITGPELMVNVPDAVIPEVGFLTVMLLFPVFALPVTATVQTIFVVVLVVYDFTDTPVPEIETVDFLASNCLPVMVITYVPPC